MKGIAYVRVSTKEQDEETQIKSIEEFAKGRFEIVKWYVDKGESGSKPFKERPSASQLLNELDALKPECLITWSIDRLGRTMIDTLNTIINLENLGIKVITVREEWLQNLDPNIRKLILSILSWVAEFEKKRLRERQEEAWKTGKQKGRPQKISDNTIMRYLKKYNGLSVKAIWKIVKADGHEISYDRFLKRVRKLKRSVNA
jgi:DNA invertase Pin-like site-specific DNA recombinase